MKVEKSILLNNVKKNIILYTDMMLCGLNNFINYKGNNIVKR